MPINPILEYQKIDLKVYKIERKFRNSKESQRLQYIYNKYREEKDSLAQLEKEAMEVMQTFNKKPTQLTEISTIESHVDEDISVIDDLAELDLYKKNLDEYEEALTAIEKESSRTIKRLADIKLTAKDFHENLKELTAKTRAQKKRFDEKQKEIMQKARPYLVELRQLQKAIDPTLLKRYTALRKEHKLPAFVEYVDGTCTGCGIHIASEVDSKLQKKGSFTECPECRRLVYKA